ncbi:MAG: T9SS type A sorting domain-containing protein [Bacteroidales bacterium]|nr:T9SS type A sorting domain-containing protein [Bacteroidales bacterium]
MKNLLLAAFISIFFVNTSAFNYKPIRLGSDLLFSTYDSFGFLVDSLAIEGNDTTIYPKPVFFRLGDGRYPLKSTPLGKCIIQKANGDNFIITRNDTFLIISNAKVGEKWVMHTSSTGLTLLAEVTAITNEKVLENQVDSVKTIKLTYTDDASSFYKWNSKQLKISKNFGLISAFSFEEFPTYQTEIGLAGMTNPTLGQQNLTWKEVWGMDVGDEVHQVVAGGNTYPGTTPYREFHLTIKKYLQKWTTNDTIHFKIEHFTLDSTKIGSDPYVMKYRHDTIFETIEPIPNFDNYPGVYYKDYVIYNHNYSDGASKFVDSNFSLFQTSEDGGNYGNIAMIGEGCGARNDVYSKYIGGPYYQCGDGVFHNFIIYCPYSKIKGVETGKKLVITGIQPHYAVQFASVLVSSVSKEMTINVNTSELPADLKIIGIDGKTVVQSELWNEKSNVSLNKLRAGIYIYQLRGYGKQIKQGKIVLR